MAFRLACSRMSRALGSVRAVRATPCRQLAVGGPDAWRGMALLQSARRDMLSSRVRPLAASAGSGLSSAAGGGMDSELITTITGKISTALETERVNVVDVNGDGRHIAIDVVSPVFEGKSLVQRQRLVYKAIWLELQEAVHAVDAMSTKTPAEADGV